MITRQIAETIRRPFSKAENGFQNLLESYSKYRWAVYFSIALVLVLIWYGPYLISKKVGIFDTSKDMFFFAYVGQSLKTFNYPFFFVAPPWSVAHYPTLVKSHAVFANPEVYSLSPDMIFMPFLSTVRFVKVHFALHFFVGIFGVYLLSKRLRLRLEFSLGLLLLVILNPWYLQHLAIGYYPWINAALFPLIAALLIPNAKRKYDVCFAALLNSLILYQGGFHLFFWFNGTALIVSIVSCFKYISVRPLVRVFGFYCVTFFAALPKLLFGASAYGGEARPIFGSWDTLEGLWAVFTDCLTDPYKVSHAINNIPWYDGSLYMGIFFIVLVLVSIVLASVKQRWKVAIDEMLIPGIILIIISWESGWSNIVSFFDSATEAVLGRPIYILHAERYPYRFLFPCLLLMSVFAMVQLSSFVSHIKKSISRVSVSCALCILLSLVARDLWARNHYFSQVALSRTQEYYEKWNLKDYMRKVPVLGLSGENLQLIPVIWQDGTIGPNKIEMPARLFSRSDVIVLPWFKSSDVSLFKAENCEIGRIKLGKYLNTARGIIKNTWLGKDYSAVTVKIIDRQRNVVLTYKKGLFFATMIIGFSGVAIAFALPMVTTRFFKQS